MIPPALATVALALVLAAGCRGGCSRPNDPAATVKGRLALLPEPVRDWTMRSRPATSIAKTTVRETAAVACALENPEVCESCQ